MKTRARFRALSGSVALLAAGMVQMAALSGPAQAMLERGADGGNFLQASGVVSSGGRITGGVTATARPTKAAHTRKTEADGFLFMASPPKIADAKESDPRLVFDAAVLFPNAANWEAKVVSATGDLMSCDMTAGSLCVPPAVTNPTLALIKRRIAKRSGRNLLGHFQGILPDKQTVTLVALALLVLGQVLIRDKRGFRYGRSGGRRYSRRRRRSGSAVA